MAVAGELATAAEVTGWPEGEARKGVKVCFEAWLNERGLKPADGDAAWAGAYLEQNDSSFVMGDEHGSSETRDRAGFKRSVDKTGEVEYCVFQEVFKQIVCESYNPLMVARALKDQGYLVTDGNHLAVTRVIPGTEKQRSSVYAIRGCILAGDLAL